jgi:glycosyltransferase involved in cell wall biosynthesis
MENRDDVISISFVTPVYRGEEYLSALVEREEAFRAHLEASPLAIRLIESIFVCDDPVDGSAALLSSLAVKRPWMTVLYLAKNVGQHAATAAGMLHASGDWVATLDEDGQHDPFRILDLVQSAIEGGLDVCYARPRGAVHGDWWRNVSSRWAKRIAAFLVNDPHVRIFNSFRLVRGEIARAAGALASYDLYLDVAFRWLTDRVGSTFVDSRDPRVGTRNSGYSLRSLVSHFRRMVMSYQLRILNLVTFGGLLTAVFFGLVGVSAVLVKLLAPARIPVQGWTSTIVTIAFFGGLTVFLLGIILDRLSLTLTRSQGRPAFFLVDRSRDGLWSKEARDELSVSPR